MKKHILLGALAALSLIACHRENPLLKVNADDLGYWVYKNRTPAIHACAKVWNDRATMPESEIKACDPVAGDLAKLLSDNGYGDIRASDVLLPTLWISYFNRNHTSDFKTSKELAEEWWGKNGGPFKVQKK